jgi:hypothetical protein
MEFSIFLGYCFHTKVVFLFEFTTFLTNLFRISGFDPPPARVFAWRVLELKEQGVSEDYAMAVADVTILF